MVSASGERCYKVVDAADVGLGTRSITSVTDAEGNRALITTNAGDASMSRIPIRDGKLGRQQVVSFSHHPKPIGLATIDEGGCTRYLLNYFFSFNDTDGGMVAATDDLDRLFGMSSMSDVTGPMQVLLRRPGCFGFREVDTWRDNAGRHHIAAIDLGQSRFHLLTDVLSGDTVGGEHQAIDLPVAGEPCRVGAVASL